MDERFGRWWILGLLALYLLLAAWLPAVDDEVYYWCWSKELQWSYYDHPPMTAVLIRLSTLIFGDSPFAFRVPACIASTLVVYVISRLTRSVPIVLAALLCPPYNLFGVLITPDSPLIAFWAAYVWWLIELHRRLDREDLASAETSRMQNILWWTFGGILLGCGVLSKYTMALAVPACFISLLFCRRPWYRWLPGYIYHGAVSFVVTLPILIFNIQRHFEPLLFQWKHAAQKSSAGWSSFGEFVGGQMLLFGTMPIVMLPWAIWNFRRLIGLPRLRVCVCFYAVPLLFFLYKAMQARLEGNWALVCFVSFWPIADVWYEAVRRSRTWRTLTAMSFLPPACALTALAIHLVVPIPLLPVKFDRVYRQIGVNTATHQMAELLRQRGESLPVYTHSYQMTALLRYQKLDARQQFDPTTRRSHFTDPPQRLTDQDRAYVVSGIPFGPEFAEGFEPPEEVASVPINVRGTTVVTLHAWLYTKTPAIQPESQSP